MVSTTRSRICKGALRGSISPLILFAACAGTAGAQQAIVAEATHPGSHPVYAMLQTDPPAPPEPPQSSEKAAKDDLFAGTEKFAKGASDVTEVSMDPDSLNLVDGDAAKKAHRTILSVVKTYSYDKPGMYKMSDVEEYRQKLERGDWRCSLHTRDLKSGESTDICSRRRAPDMIESAIITIEPKELTFIHTIKRSNGQGGSLDLGSMPEAFVHLPPNVAMLMYQPDLAAEILAQTAGIRDRMPEVMESLRSAQELGSHEVEQEMKKLQRDMKDFPAMPALSPEQKDNLQKLQDQLKDMEKHS